MLRTRDIWRGGHELFVSLLVTHNDLEGPGNQESLLKLRVFKRKFHSVFKAPKILLGKVDIDIYALGRGRLAVCTNDGGRKTRRIESRIVDQVSEHVRSLPSILRRNQGAAE